MQVWLGVSEGRHEVLGAPTPRKRVLLRQACTSEGQHRPQLQPLGKDHKGDGKPEEEGDTLSVPPATARRGAGSSRSHC